MKNSLNNILPDSFTGAIMAIEGIQDAAVLLNGPTGCKFYHGALSDGQLPRVVSLNPLKFIEEFYFGQPRVPATYIDENDYIFGSSDKLEKILPVVAGKGHSLIAIINSPGAALIGDNLNRFIDNASLSIPCVAIENTGFFGMITDGYKSALMATLEHLSFTNEAIIEKSVNLIGISIFHKYWEESINELRNLLSLCGIKVLCTLCADTTINEMMNLPRAQCNIIIHEEYGEEVALWLKDKFKTPCVTPSEGAPIGFLSTEKWILEAASAVNADPTPALQTISTLSRYNSITGLPKGATFSINADPSVAYPLTKWLYSYLGMMPIAITSTHVGATKIDKKLTNFLEEINCSNAREINIPDVISDIIFADGNTIAMMQGKEITRVGIEIALPSSGYINIIPRTLLGTNGALYILEQIVNGLFGVGKR